MPKQRFDDKAVLDAATTDACLEVIGEKLGRALRLPQLHVETVPERCVGCGACTKACPMSLPVDSLALAGPITHSECIRCGACCDACRENALRLSLARVKER